MIALIIQGRLFKSICMCNDENNPHILYNLSEKGQDILTSAIVYTMGNYFVTNIGKKVKSSCKYPGSGKNERN
jgi:hypothetical protein